MPRKPLLPPLPPLPEVFPNFTGWSATQNKTATVLALLRTQLPDLRQERTVVFYPMRTVAEFFQLSLKSVAGVYQQLEAEGFLVRLRGSKTMLRSRRPQPRQAVRGVIGLPVYLPGFYYGALLRDFYITLENELRRQRYVADLIFFRDEEQADPELTERLLEHNLDAVLWWAPSAQLLTNVHRLLDCGVRTVLVSDGRVAPPFAQYFLNLERALTEGFTAWRADGIRSVVVLRSPLQRSQFQARLLADLVARLGLEHETLVLHPADTVATLHRLARRPQTGCVLIRHGWYESLCRQFPAATQHFFQRCRVLLLQGPFAHPAFAGQSVPVDVLTLTTVEYAKRIARDIGSGRAWDRQKLATFHAQWQPRLDLGAITPDI